MRPLFAIASVVLFATASRAELWQWSPAAAHHNSVGVVRAGGSGGSGSYIVHDGVYGFITAHHVTRGAATATIEFPGGQRASGTPANCKFGHDCAFVKLSQPIPNLAPLVLASSSPSVGDAVECVGYGGPRRGAREGQRHWLTRITAIHTGNIEMAGSSVSGDSGGPIFNSQHEIVGLVCYGRGQQPLATQSGWTAHDGSGGPSLPPLRAFIDRVALECPPDQQPGGT